MPALWGSIINERQIWEEAYRYGLGEEVTLLTGSPRAAALITRAKQIDPIF
jgi:hypothetical protein